MSTISDAIRLHYKLVSSVCLPTRLPLLYCRAAAAICAPLLAWAWTRHLRYWYYEYSPIAYPGDVKTNRLQRRYAKIWLLLSLTTVCKARMLSYQYEILSTLQ